MKRFIAHVFIALSLAACGYSPGSAEAAQNAQSIQFLLSQVRNSAGIVAGGKVYAYAAGTTTPKTLWLNRSKATVAANPYTLDANGTAALFGDGLYRIVIKTAAGVTVYDRDNISVKDVANYTVDAADYTSLPAAIAAIGATPATLQFAADQTLTSNLTVPSNVELMPISGAKINHGTYTISYAGSTARWPDAQIFNGTGLVSVPHKSVVEWFGAVSDWNGSTGTDSGPAINRAVAALTKGGEVRLSGRYYSTVEIVTPNQPHVIAGTAMPGVTDTTGGTSITFAAGVNGIKQDGPSSQLRNIGLLSLDNGAASSAIGYDSLNAKQETHNVLIMGFGGTGYRVDSTVNGNVNMHKDFGSIIQGSGGDGLYIAGADSNAHVFTGTNITASVGRQLYNQGSRNWFVGVHIDGGVTGGKAVYDNAIGNYYNIYVESYDSLPGTDRASNDFEIGTSSVYGAVMGLFYALPHIKGDTVAMSTWDIYERVSHRSFALSDKVGGYLAGKQWKFWNGLSSSGTLEMNVAEPDGTGSVTALEITGDGSRFITPATIEPTTTATKDLGTTTARWRDAYLSQSINLNGITVKTGTGTPEAVVTAPVGSLFLRTDGGASTTLYVKTSGVGNTGWTAK